MQLPFGKATAITGFKALGEPLYEERSVIGPVRPILLLFKDTATGFPVYQHTVEVNAADGSFFRSDKIK